MTTIAWDGKVLASDSRETTAAGIFADDSQKVFHFKGIGWCAAAGDSEECEEFYDWVGHDFAKKLKPKWDKKVNVVGIFISEKTGKAWVYYDKLIPLPITPPKAFGSGGTYAFTSMKIGFDAATAVQHAIVCDHRSGGAVQSFRTKVKKK